MWIVCEYVRVSYVDAESRVHARHDLAVCGGARIQPVFPCVGRRTPCMRRDASVLFRRRKAGARQSSGKELCEKRN